VNCPACSEALIKGQERCPRCGTVVYLPVEGALAPDPQLTPPPRKGEPLREIPGMKKRERTWKDEVRERVRDRRQRRMGSADLPLFRDQEEGLSPAAEEPEAAGPEAGIHELGEAADLAPDDLPLRPIEAPPVAARPEPPLPPLPARRDVPSIVEEDEDAAEEWPLEPVPEAARPVERPARVAERLWAAAIDTALLAALFAVVVYFASRAAQVTVPRLLPSWPFLAGYLAFLGLAYAGYFTGTTGQTLGKILAGLRVVDGAGQPPGFLKAFVRAALGAVGIAAAGLGAAPMLADPAGRALHDRLLKTRVVKF
jgi:uncharacterized RDD family membrane protein YckC